MKLLQIMISAQQLMISPDDRSKVQICRFHSFHLHLHPHPHRRPATFVEAITLQGDISFRKLFVKNGFRESSDGYFIN